VSYKFTFLESYMLLGEIIMFDFLFGQVFYILLAKRRAHIQSAYIFRGDKASHILLSTRWGWSSLLLITFTLLIPNFV
jgi:hypothetical protein